MSNIQTMSEILGIDFEAREADARATYRAAVATGELQGDAKPPRRSVHAQSSGDLYIERLRAIGAMEPREPRQSATYVGQNAEDMAVYVFEAW